MKKIALYACCALLGLVSTACQEKDDPETGTGLGLCFNNPSNDWRKAAASFAEAAAKELKLDYALTQAVSPAAQAKHLAELVNDGAGVIVLLSEGVAPEAVQMVIDLGVPVILCEGKLDVDYTAYVTYSNSEVGKTAAQGMIGSGATNVAVFSITQNPDVSLERVTGFKTELSAEYPTVTYVDQICPTYTRADGKTAALAVLAANPTVDAFYAQDDEVALGVLDAIRQQNVTNIKIILGCGGSSEYFAKMGTESAPALATVTYSPFLTDNCVRLAADVLDGKTLAKKDHYLPVSLVNKANMSGFTPF